MDERAQFANAVTSDEKYGGEILSLVEAFLAESITSEELVTKIGLLKAAAEDDHAHFPVIGCDCSECSEQRADSRGDDYEYREGA